MINNQNNTNQNAKVALNKAKNLLNITKTLLVKQENNQLVEDNWIERLWKWADENNIPDPDAEKGRWFDDKNETWGKGIPREKTRLLNLLELNLTGAFFNPNEIKELPIEITYLTHIKGFTIHNQKLSRLPNNISNLKNLEELILSSNPLKELPVEICNFKRLKYLSLTSCSSLVLTREQKDWINKLKNNGCTVYTDDDLFSRITTEIDIDEDEIPF